MQIDLFILSKLHHWHCGNHMIIHISLTTLYVGNEIWRRLVMETLSASLALSEEKHKWPVNSPYTWSVIPRFNIYLLLVVVVVVEVVVVVVVSLLAERAVEQTVELHVKFDDAVLMWHYCTEIFHFMLLHFRNRNMIPQYSAIVKCYNIIQVIIYMMCENIRQQGRVCITTTISQCRKPLNQWQHIFQMKAALPLANRLVTGSDRISNTGPCIRFNHITLKHVAQWFQLSLN